MPLDPLVSELEHVRQSAGYIVKVNSYADPQKFMDEADILDIFSLGTFLSSNLDVFAMFLPTHAIRCLWTGLVNIYKVKLYSYPGYLEDLN